MVQNLKKVLKLKISKKNSFLRHEVPFKAKNNREAVVVCAIHVVKRPSKRSVLVLIIAIHSYLLAYSIFIQASFACLRCAAADTPCPQKAPFGHLKYTDY